MSKFLILKKRRDFLRAAGDVTVIYEHVIVQAAQALPEEDHKQARIGFTATKKVGHAYKRNRMKRRMRAVVREIYEKYAKDYLDYVIVARRDTDSCAFKELRKDIKRAIRKVNKTFIIRNAENDKNKKKRKKRRQSSQNIDNITN